MSAHDRIAEHFAAISRARMKDIAGQSNGIVTAEESRRAHLQGCADHFLAKARLPLPESVTVRDAMIDDGAEPELTDDEIIQMVAECYGMTTAQAIQRLEAIDFAKAREAGA